MHVLYVMLQREIESYGDTRTESDKATAKTFYAELHVAWRYQLSWSSGVGSGSSRAAMAAPFCIWQIEATPTNLLYTREHAHSRSHHLN